eukprot:Gregarina_sp_Pseudo_9__5277@NODE_606_length_2498_cov_71_494103_g572_i0_p1_GENE_NODE_606_length_2498_cov_71_494103_g572_i0NODE_606_length_2498_cov_71_494103_g572_i0_p1_ORF_typecomplete_len529_score80_80UDPG_MGDP_dh_N/PF03721_14/2_8e61UDPG_MGDP_dh_N/PF03721_14/5_6e02UDPG_MGDP_dh/PF00984_19/1_6e32UDPG_MGDP_dh/PF00984_19/8_4e03UDPG_MGDP_dh_C/PF03720_15/1_2e03UDPG_MGDP_dh_C/PF03720_15/1_3e30NAD_binding_2/PF03446_15/2_8e06NAD_binding_2/PF03446_15/10NAD_binding_7/PF13241_6/7_9NAD_binding_7/PF13241_6/3_
MTVASPTIKDASLGSASFPSCIYRRPTRIACIGAGYVGTPTSAVIALMCADITVVVLDISQERIDAFNSDRLPIHEPGLDEIVKKQRGINLFFSTDLKKHIEEADLVFVSVNTPTKQSGLGAGAASDLSSWEAAGRSIAEYATSPKIIVEKSTVPVRTAGALAKVLAANKKPGAQFTVLSNPEFLAEGTAISDLKYPDRVLVGGDDSQSGRCAIECLAWVYEHWIPKHKIITMALWSAELSKLAANAFLAQRISSINSIALVCEKTGARIEEVSHAIGMDSRIGSKFLHPSVGFGGSCFKKDILNLVYLAQSQGLPEVAEYWHQVVKMNDFQKNVFVARMVRAMFNTLRGKKIAVFGFAFKKDTADVRETPALDVCLALLEEGADVHVFDPLVTKDAAVWEAKQQQKNQSLIDRLVFEETPRAAVHNADAIAIVTEWDMFVDLDYREFFNLMRKPAFLFDGRLILNHAELFEIGFDVRPIGQPRLSALPDNSSITPEISDQEADIMASGSPPFSRMLSPIPIAKTIPS